MNDHGPLEPTQLVTRSDTVTATELDGETVMMSVESGKYYHLDAVGTDIWKVLDRPSSLDGIVSHLLSLYSVSEEQCRVDTLEFLDTLLAGGVVRRV